MLKKFLVSSLVLLSFAAVSAEAQILPACRPIPGTCEQCAKDCETDCKKAADPSTCESQCTESRQCDLPECKASNLLELAVNIYNFLLGLAGMIALLMIIWAGLRMLYWTFTEEQEQELANAKHTLSRAIAGLIIVLLAYVIVNTLIVLLGGGGITEVLNRAFGSGQGPATDSTCTSVP